jgi:hypothetical protein
MALVIFRSKAAADITMFAESARRIFEIVGRPESARGVITAEQIPDALQRLTAAVEQDKAQYKASADAANDESESKGMQARGVTFSQRAFPLIEMLRAAQKKGADVTWGA